MNEETVIKVEADELIIEPKNGKVIDLENSDLSVGKIVFKKKENEFPTKWEDMPSSIINKFSHGFFPTKEEDEAFIALRKLCWLRDAYNREPLADWCNWKSTSQCKYCIEVSENKISIFNYKHTRKVLSFKTEKLRDKFLENFEDLILTAIPLL